MTTEEIIAGLWEIIDHECIDQQHRIDALEDAITFIRYHTPRVLTLEEVKAIGARNYKNIAADNDCVEIVWIETPERHGLLKATLTPSLIAYYYHLEDYSEYYNAIFQDVFGNDCDSRLPLNEYLKKWRCWSDRPTDDQRKAVKWG